MTLMVVQGSDLVLFELIILVRLRFKSHYKLVSTGPQTIGAATPDGALLCLDRSMDRSDGRCAAAAAAAPHGGGGGGGS